MILHVDMDAFYASVEERENPWLIGKPVIVGGTAEGRGVVAAANYEARKFGVHSAMASARAERLCPHVIVIRPRMDHYAAVSRQIREIFERFTPVIEPLSLDEAFLNATGSEALFGPSAEIGRQIKRLIRAELQLVASVGVAPNKFLAKIASDIQKPDGFVVVDPSNIQAFLDPLPVGRIWGVGKMTGQVFERLGIKTIAQLRTLPVETLNQIFGASGEHFWRLARGIDDRPVIPDREAKSISHETTFAEDIDDKELLRAWLVDLVELVARRMRHYDLKGRAAEIKVRFADFQTITRSATLGEPTNSTHELLAIGLALLDRRLPEPHLPVRLLGFGAHQFDGKAVTQQLLFDQRDRERNRELDTVADQITAKFGQRAIRRGLGIQRDD
jgi:DNA polymerase-4